MPVIGRQFSRHRQSCINVGEREPTNPNAGCWCRRNVRCVPSPSLADIQKAAGEVFGVARAELIGISRQARVAHARAVAVQLCRQLTNSSYPQIGRAFHRHHATIIALERRAHDLVDTFPDYTNKRQAILRKLGFDRYLRRRVSRPLKMRPVLGDALVDVCRSAGGDACAALPPHCC